MLSTRHPEPMLESRFTNRFRYHQHCRRKSKKALEGTSGVKDMLNPSLAEETVMYLNRDYWTIWTFD
jgi:hypothetical protein